MKGRRVLPMLLLTAVFAAPDRSAATETRWRVELPLAAGPMSVAHANIDSHAQLALVDLIKDGGDAASDAVLMFSAVKAQRLGGIYIEDQGVPALRAQAWGTSWWKLIPKGLDAVVLPAPQSEPSSAPILVLSKSAAKDASKRKAALLDAWAAFFLYDTGVITRCSAGVQVQQIAGAKHCLPAKPLPSSLPAPKQLIQQDMSFWPPFHADYRVHAKPAGTCARVFTTYDDCVKLVGVEVKPNEKRNMLHAPQPASQWSSKQHTHTKAIDQQTLLAAFAPSPLHPASSAEGKTQRQNLDKFLGPVNEAFEILGFDTVESKAFFFAHYAGELGGNPPLLGLEEVLANNGGHNCTSPKSFIGRGPLQPTCRNAYLLTLAYAEYEANARYKQAADKTLHMRALAFEMVQQGFNQAKFNQLIDEYIEIEALLRAGQRITQMINAVAADPTEASEFEHGVLFSAFYWHANACGKQLEKLALAKAQTTGTTFTGKNAGAVCISGGNTTDSSSGRATVKSAVYNCTVNLLQGKACPNQPSPSQDPDTGGKQQIKVPKARKKKIKVPKIR